MNLNYSEGSIVPKSPPLVRCKGDVKSRLSIARTSVRSVYSAYLSGFRRADERTRTADLLQLRVCL